MIFEIVRPATGVARWSLFRLSFMARECLWKLEGNEKENREANAIAIKFPWIIIFIIFFFLEKFLVLFANEKLEMLAMRWWQKAGAMIKDATSFFVSVI